MTDTEPGNGRAWYKGWKIGFGTRDPYSEHGVDGDVSNSKGNHSVLDIFRVVGGLNGLKAGKALGESFVWEVLQDEFFVFHRFVSVNCAHLWYGYGNKIVEFELNFG